MPTDDCNQPPTYSIADPKVSTQLTEYQTFTINQTFNPDADPDRIAKSFADMIQKHQDSQRPKNTTIPTIPSPNAPSQPPAIQFWDRVSDTIAEFGGTWAYIFWFLGLLLAYCLIQEGLGRHAWDGFPYVFLNLLLGVMATLQAPFLMMSDARQRLRDRQRLEQDLDVDTKTETVVETLQAEIIDLKIALNNVADKLDALARRDQQKQHFGETYGR